MKKISNTISLTAICCGLLAGCAPHPQVDDEATQLQVRQIQSREFDTSDTKLVMKSMMNVLQDEGYIVKNAVADLGLLSAEKNIDVENKTAAVLLTVLSSSNNPRWDKHQVREVSANISEYGCKTRVRVNFQTKTMDNYGCPTKVETVKDPQVYLEFFDKVSKGIFIQEQEI